MQRTVPVTLRIRTRRICRVVRAFDPSGVKVNSASLTRLSGASTVSSRATWAGEFVADPSWHRLIAASTSSSAPRWCHDPSCGTVADLRQPLEHLVDGLGLRMDATREPSLSHTATALIDGQNRLQTCLIQYIIESSSESSPYHCRSVHQRRDSSPEVSAACRAQAIRGRPQMSLNPQISNSFRHQSQLATDAAAPYQMNQHPSTV